jgi:hypothetical protein
MTIGYDLRKLCLYRYWISTGNGISITHALAECSSIFDVDERTIRRWLEGGNDLAQIVPAPLRKRGPKQEYVVKKEHVRWMTST